MLILHRLSGSHSVLESSEKAVSWPAKVEHAQIYAPAGCVRFWCRNSDTARTEHINNKTTKDMVVEFRNEKSPVVPLPIKLASP